MTQYVNAKVEKIERPITAWLLLGLIGLLGSTYAFFLAGAIANVIEAKDVTANVAIVANTISELEAEYLSTKSAVDLDYAKSEGFTEAHSVTIYIAKQAGSELSLNR